MKSTFAALALSIPCLFACSATPPTSGTGGTGGTGTGGSGGNPTTGDFPCDVKKVVAQRCWLCHGPTPVGGAPMSLYTYANSQAPRSSSELTWQAMKRRILEGTMPPASYPSLTADEKTTLANWFNAGAPPGPNQCPNFDLVPPEAGVDKLPCVPQYYFRSNSGGNPYPVPTGTDNKYVNIPFSSPFKAGEQAIAWAPVIDNARVIHHYILYGNPGQVFVAGWAPGGVNAVMAPDLGLVLDFTSFSLQVHYNNKAGPDATDSSGVAFCTTTTPREHPTGIVTLGNPFFTIPNGAANYPVKASCTSLAADGTTPITIVAGSAHMHLTGTGFHTELDNSSGALKNVITDIPLGTWSFDNQHPQPNPLRPQFLPGDRLNTTCYYTNTTGAAISFGEKTTNEMCFDFMSVYPITKANKLCIQ